MNVHVRPQFTALDRHLPFESVALVLQGGGALGAYQAGVYEALAEETRVDKLRAFWEGVTAIPHLDLGGNCRDLRHPLDSTHFPPGMQK